MGGLLDHEDDPLYWNERRDDGGASGDGERELEKEESKFYMEDLGECSSEDEGGCACDCDDDGHEDHWKIR